MSTRTELPPQVGRYRVVRKLGEGGMGVVYLAEDALLGRKVAIKVPILQSENDIKRFQREARVAASVDHPNICSILDIGELDGVHYLIMPFIEGKPLSDLIEDKQPPPARTVVELVQRIATAIQSMHDAGLMHRDLKPANILLKQGRDPVIMDFGLARSFSGADPRLTSTGAIVGTPAYMSPEQLNGDPTAMGAGTDIYSLGVILYELLTGKPPFIASSIQAVYTQIFFTMPKGPSTLRADLDKDLDPICLKAMAKSAKDRYASMTDFATALEQWLKKAPTLSDGPPEISASSGEVRMACPSCGAKLRLPASARGKKLKCSACKSSVIAPNFALMAGATPRPSQTVSNQPQSIPSGPIDQTRRGPQSTVSGGTPPPSAKTAARGSIPTAPAISIPAHDPILEITNSVGMKLKLVPRGKFLMGSPPEEKGHSEDEFQHEIEITRRFYIGVYTVSQAEYAVVMARNPAWFTANGGGKDKIAGVDTDRLPVESVSWNEAQEFCRKLSALPDERRGGRVYRLPTEAEWEFACRGGAGGTALPFHVGSALSFTQANFDGRWPYGGAPKGPSLDRPNIVGSYPPNALGLHDLHGNVWEWCEDWYETDYYRTGPAQDPFGPTSSSELCRVLRGGSWGDGAQMCRAACRVREAPQNNSIFIGFRVAMTTNSIAQ